MEKKMLILALVVSTLLVLGSVGRATVIMDGTLHNGSLTATAAGNWTAGPDSLPAGWEETATNCYTAAYMFTIVGSTGEGVNNTGELVEAGHAYTVTASLGGNIGVDPTVRAYATENIDGTGTKVELASVHRFSVEGEGYDLTDVTGSQGAQVAPGIVGYYIQVAIGGPYVDHYISGYYDNIGVTSELIPEPATMILLGIGGLFLRRKK